MTPSMTAWPPTIRSRSLVLTLDPYLVYPPLPQVVLTMLGSLLTTMPAILSGCADWMQSDQPAVELRRHLQFLTANDAIASSSNSFARGRLRRLTIASIKSIHASRGIDQLLLACKKRVACRTNFNVQIALLRRTRLKSLTARASNSDLAL